MSRDIIMQWLVANIRSGGLLFRESKAELSNGHEQVARAYFCRSAASYPAPRSSAEPQNYTSSIGALLVLKEEISLPNLECL